MNEPDTYITAHLEVPGEMFDIGMQKSLNDEGVVGSTADILNFIRDKAETVYHPVGTCKMGQDPMAVVDEQLKVRGIEGLRVRRGEFFLYPCG